MAINKRAKNLIIKMNDKYTSNSGSLIKYAESVNIESTKENLSLNCNKKIVSQGNKE
ncbi:hypothetical protein [Dysgonomonas sp. 25]|uniref:hypothetical protein n=1 Tax=Dysgonomonas sp. 25 TaxID=2302933 RepID=UPI0013D3D7B3|nr:hypothetical protein [Dysgonomonas sp. 25]